MELVIKGAFYYDRENKRLLVPHYSGVHWIVDCDIYYRMNDLKEMYDITHINDVKESRIEYDGHNYYSAEYNCADVEDWKLLSDLSNLEHHEEDFDF